MSKVINSNDEKQLNNCLTVADMLQYITTTFDLNVKVGVLVKSFFIKGLISGIEMIKPKRK